jgi:hypothetical protein
VTDAHFSFTLGDLALILLVVVGLVAACSAPFVAAFHWLLHWRWLWSGILGVVCGILAFLATVVLLNVR